VFEFISPTALKTAHKPLWFQICFHEIFIGSHLVDPHWWGERIRESFVQGNGESSVAIPPGITQTRLVIFSPSSSNRRAPASLDASA
jgi:hypothetical protein